MKNKAINLSYGRNHLAIPGPSNIPERVLQAINRSPPNIYGEEIAEVTYEVMGRICKFANTKGKVVIYVANGHGVWEASLVNLFRKGDTILLCSNGHFGHKWGLIAQGLGLKIIHLDVGYSRTVKADDITKILRRDKSHKIKGVLAVHTDTSSSGRNKIRTFKEAMESIKHPALLLIDAIASFGCEKIEMDPWGIDVIITASQKGLMTPPGLAYCIVSKRAEEHARMLKKKNPDISPYWDWGPRLNPKQFYNIFSGTAPTNLLFGQLEALKIMEAEGRNNIFLRHKILASMVWEFVEHLGSGNNVLSPNIKNRQERSTAVTTIFSKGFDFGQIREWISKQGGVDLGIGIGFSKPELMGGKSVFRIGHMGHLNPHMILGVLSLLEAGLSKFNFPHQKGGLASAIKMLDTMA